MPTVYLLRFYKKSIGQQPFSARGFSFPFLLKYNADFKKIKL